MTMRWTYPLLALAMACSSAENAPPDDNMNPPPNKCGDGVMRGSEQCDDGNIVSNDGCSATCLSEGSGTCGNSQIEGFEECDDGNTTSNDGCSANCTTEGGGASNGTCNAPFELTLTNDMGDLVGEATGDTSTSTNQVADAACDAATAGAGKDHVWSFTLTDTRDVYILVDSTMTAFDSVLRVTTTACDVGTELAEYAGADGCVNAVQAAEEFIGYVALTPGTYFITIDGATASDAGAYRFRFLATTVKCGDGQLDPLEFCDDADSAAGNGCNAKCEVEPGYTCTLAEPSVCTPDSTSTAPAPGELKLNEYMAADNASDTNCDGKTTGTDDEFVELINTTATKTLNLEGVTIADSVIVRHTFGALTLPPGKAVVVWTAGTPMCPGVTMFDVASTGQLGLNDAGDTITVALGSTTLDTVSYASATLNKSTNRSPDVTGTAWAVHDQVATAVGNYSPGKKVDGSAF